MKRLLYTLFLLPIVIFSQTKTENYIKTTTYFGESTYAYDNFFSPIPMENIFTEGQNTSGNGIIGLADFSVFLEDDLLTINIISDLNNSGNGIEGLGELVDGIILNIDIPQNIPDFPNLGELYFFHGDTTGYRVSIESNYLKLTQVTNEPFPSWFSGFRLENYSYEIDLDPDDLNKAKQITYYDGLGRPKQTISKQAGGNRQDIITPIVYDGFGRQVLEYLPYANPLQTTGSNLDYREESVLLDDMSGYYQAKYPDELDFDNDNPNFYSNKILESSPLNRIMELGAPGKDWFAKKHSDTDHTIKFEYNTNLDSDYIKHYEVSFINDDIESPQLVDSGLYLPNELYKTITKDENWQPNQTHPTDHTTEEYKDLLGQVILKRTFDKGKWHDTYYIYDDFGNLTYVLPPQANTYHLITQQPWVGKNYSFENVSGLFNSDTDYNEIGFYFSLNGNFYLNIIAEGEEIEFEDGLVFNLDFIDPPLPNMDIGELEHDNGIYAGDLYIYSGDLYIDVGLMGYGYFENDFSIPFSNYQNNFTVPPLNVTQLNELCYQYKYDYRNRLIEKKIPGKEWEHIVYDKLDRPILTQDANLRLNNDWLFTKYDVFGRVVYTGKHHFVPTTSGDNGGRLDLQEDIDTQSAPIWFESKLTQYPIDGSNQIGGVLIDYTNQSFPTTNLELFTVNFYDNYYFYDEGISYSDSYGQTLATNSKALSTGSKVRVLGTDDWITTVTYYDDKARPIYTSSKNEYLNTLDWTKTQLDFVGKVLEATSRHQKTGQPYIETLDTFTYDHTERLLTQSQIINNGTPELIVNNHYDELGQLESKNVGGMVAANPEQSAGLQTVDYKYNIRGWLKEINDVSTLGNNLFGFKLNYNNPISGTALYNGNISQTQWKTDNIDTSLKTYTYSYDALNRITAAMGNVSNYNLNSVAYDKNGNIISLVRRGHTNYGATTFGIMDDLTYYYQANSNKLIKVEDSAGHDFYGFKDDAVNPATDTSNDYTYDSNGNMTTDKTRKLPVLVTTI